VSNRAFKPVSWRIETAISLALLLIHASSGPARQTAFFIC
jgi:hypothetical protein